MKFNNYRISVGIHQKGLLCHLISEYTKTDEKHLGAEGWIIISPGIDDH